MSGISFPCTPPRLRLRLDEKVVFHVRRTRFAERDGIVYLKVEPMVDNPRSDPVTLMC